MMDRRKWVDFHENRNRPATAPYGAVLGLIVSAATLPPCAARGAFARTGVPVGRADRMLGRLPCPG